MESIELRNKYKVLYDDIHISQLEAILDRARLDFTQTQSEEDAVRCEVLIELIDKEKKINALRP